jgi:ATP-citrate lyase beta-subunit
VAADEVYNLGHGAELGNYGEYSGNPTAEESYLYTAAVLSLLLASKAPKKVLLIGGAVANFTDIANTFSGVIQAIDAKAAELKKQGVKVFVRRGGPRQEIGLAKIEAALRQHGLLGAVYDPSRALTAVVAEAVEVVA